MPGIVGYLLHATPEVFDIMGCFLPDGMKLVALSSPDPRTKLR